MRIKWPSGQENSYRLGFGGCVDLKCVEEVPGIDYYRDHLPVVGESVELSFKFNCLISVF